MGTRTIRLSNSVENMLETLVIVNGGDSTNKTVAEAIQYRYENDPCIKVAQDKFKEGFRIYVQNFVLEEQRHNIKQVVEKVLNLAEIMVVDKKSNILTEIVNIKGMAQDYLDSIQGAIELDEEEEDDTEIISLNRMEALVGNLIEKGVFNDVETGASVIVQLCDLVTATNSCLAGMILCAQNGENSLIKF